MEQRTTTAKASPNPKIEHVVLLMLENRSFDHMCGFLKRRNNNIDGLTGNESCPYDPQNLKQGSVKVNDLSGYVTSVDPEHSLPGTTEQLFGFRPARSSDPAPMDGFIKSYNIRGDSKDKGAAIMDCFNPNTVPVISQLATEFALFDHWYAAIPGPTQPNRLFVHSATSHGATDNDSVDLAEGYPQKTIYDSLYEAGYTWKDYFHDFPSALFLSRLREPQYWDCFSDIAGFYDDVASGNLPTYSFVEPRWFNFFDWGASDQHPPHDVKLGEYLMADIYEALRAGPKWESTLFIITYDEHGGFFDHVPPPQDGVPAPDDHRPPSGQPPFSFERLGLRVPCIVVSPWINKNTVIHEPATSHYTHTSILATVKKVFDLPEYLTKRDAWSATFEDMFEQRTTPRTDAPFKILRPGSARAQDRWNKLSKKRVTEEDIESAIKGDTICNDKLTDLHREIIAIARGLPTGADPIERALVEAEAEALETEHHGAIFVQRQFLKFFRHSKEKHAALEAEKKRDAEWVVL